MELFSKLFLPTAIILPESSDNYIICNLCSGGCCNKLHSWYLIAFSISNEY